MRILMHTRPDWRELPGGDFVQLQRWAVWLRELGADVTVTDAHQPDLRGVDLVHFNNLGRAYALWPALEHCRRHGVPIVLTPLYWPPEEYERRGRPGLLGLLTRLLPDGLRERLKAAARCLREPEQYAELLREVLHGSSAPARRFLTSFDALVANSQAEAKALQSLLPDSPPIHVVHSGVDAFYWSSDAELWALEQQTLMSGAAGRLPAEEEAPTVQPSTAPRQGILCVARFDPQKGQHRLLEALRHLEMTITLVGSDNPNYPGYRAYCQKLAGQRTTILPRQSKQRLRELYRGCRVHALCSWYETTGLTGLEAGCSRGARVVMTVRGGTHDYGGDHAWYADPADLESIRQAVQQAHDADHTPDLMGRVQEQFTWQKSAQALLDAYQDVLARRDSPRRAA